MWEKLRVTFLKIQNADGNMEDAIEIVDMEEKISLGIYKIEKNAQCIVNKPLDMPLSTSIYKNYFEIVKK